jgi:hypothetical protein
MVGLEGCRRRGSYPEEHSIDPSTEAADFPSFTLTEPTHSVRQNMSVNGNPDVTVLDVREG